MKIYNLESLQSKLKVNYLFLDNNSLILLINNIEQFSSFIEEASRKGTILMTIPSISFEFSRADNINVYNERVNFLNKYISIYPIEKHLDDFDALIPIVHRLKGNSSYPDFLLYCCLYKFPSAMLLTENHNDFSTDILDRIDIITVDSGKNQIRNTALYRMNADRFNSAVESMLKQSSK